MPTPPLHQALPLQPHHPTQHLGAQVVGDGVLFGIAAPGAQRMELCLFDDSGQHEQQRLEMPPPRAGLWQAWLPHAGPGLVYGWRAHGPWRPQEGWRYNPAKLLLDPLAEEVVGVYDGHPMHLGHCEDDPWSADERDNGPQALKARVVSPLPPPQPLAMAIDPATRVIAEVHVKAATAQHPEVPAALRGRYAGLAHPAMIAHFRHLGITTLCLMPVAQRADEARLLRQGLSNHWGYNPVAWNAPEARYWSGDTPSPRHAFRDLVDRLHAAGMEVVLDVVYNHSAESDDTGPTFHLRGLDNRLYYHLPASDRSGYENWSGCGNSLNLHQPLVLRLVLDSLRHWVTQYGIDGFRFDLAPVLARRDDHHFDPHGPLLAAIAQDPVLRGRLMIAEPWDIGPGGYRLGQFPPGWLEWNDRFRDGMRRQVLHRGGNRGELACRLAGSSDVFDSRQRPPWSSINFITAHDGFTLNDLVSYSRRHNHANGEDNRDGHGHNLSAHHGTEGPTQDPVIRQRRRHSQRALLSLLMLSLGTPMLLLGDDIGHSQGGNNNAYCQDNPTTWLDWSSADTGLRDFVAHLIGLRRQLPLLQAHHWWQPPASQHGPTPSCPAGWPDPVVADWFDATGLPLDPGAWQQPDARALGLRLSQGLWDAKTPSTDTVLLLINGEAQDTVFALPPGLWWCCLDSHAEGDTPRPLPPGEAMAAGSVRLLTRHPLSPPCEGTPKAPPPTAQETTP